MVDDWGVFLREAREAGPKTLLLLLLLFEVYRVPLLCKSHALSLFGTSVVVLCDATGRVALTKLLLASLCRAEHFSTKHRRLLGTGRLREWELMQEQSRDWKRCGMRASLRFSIHEPFQPLQHPARPGANDLVQSAATRCG